jgi:putative ABC transport system permease protein
LLAALGLYGVLSFVLAADTRELAVRLALGASRGGVARLVISRGLQATAWGLAAGLVLAFASAHGVERVVPEARLAPEILAASSLVVFLAALAATAIPALRAMRVDPLDSLRGE